MAVRRAAKPRTPHAAPAKPPKPPAPDFTSLIKQAGSTAEVDFRLLILHSLTQTPHRELEPFVPLFKFIHERDPLFFSRLAVWYQDHGSVRDLKYLFIAILASSSFSEDFREAGVAMLLSLAPYEVERVYGVIKGYKNDDDKWVDGLSKSVPRVVRTGIEQYLRLREKSPEQFDSVALAARSSLRKLYGSLRIKPGEYAQKILFDNDPPPTSRLYALKLLARTQDPTEQARLIMDNKIPYRTATSNISKMSGPVLVALINSMSPQELINNMASLQKKGAFDNPDIKALIDQKIKAAETDKRVSALKTKQAVKSANLDSETVAALERVQDKQIKAKGRIKKRTALLIDKSGSMQQAIDLGKEIAALIAPICESDLYVYAFDDMAYPIEVTVPKEATMSQWENAFKGIKANGYTSCGAPIAAMQRRGQAVDQIIMVSDQEENKAPMFLPAYDSYKKALSVDPNVIFIQCGSKGKQISNLLDKAGINTDVWDFTGDYYGLPSIIPMLAGGSRLELLQEIMDLKLPARQKKELAGVKA